MAGTPWQPLASGLWASCVLVAAARAPVLTALAHSRLLAPRKTLLATNTMKRTPAAFALCRPYCSTTGCQWFLPAETMEDPLQATHYLSVAKCASACFMPSEAL